MYIFSKNQKSQEEVYNTVNPEIEGPPEAFQKK
jgi:hypothetical protein